MAEQYFLEKVQVAPKSFWWAAKLIKGSNCCGASKTPAGAIADLKRQIKRQAKA